MKNAFFGSPMIACVGQRFSQEVQHVQFSATMEKGMAYCGYQSGGTGTSRSGIG